MRIGGVPVSDADAALRLHGGHARRFRARLLPSTTLASIRRGP